MTARLLKLDRVKPIRGGLVSGVGAIVALLALSPAISWAAYPGANGLIVGEGGGGGAYPEIWTISPDGSDPTRLADNAVLDLQPS